VTFTISNTTIYYDSAAPKPAIPLFTFSFSGTAWAGGATLVTGGDNIATEGENKYVVPPKPKPKSTFSITKYVPYIVLVVIVALVSICAGLGQCAVKKRKAQGVAVNKLQQGTDGYPMQPMYTQQQSRY
jgi:hypothetical protein